MKSKTTKRLFIALLITFSLLLIAFMLLFWGLSTQTGTRFWVNSYIGNFNSDRKATVSVYDIQGTFLDGIVLNDIKVKDGDQDDILLIQSVKAKLKGTSLLKGTLQFEYVTLESATVYNYIKQGRSSFEDLKAPPTKPKEPKEKPLLPTSVVPIQFDSVKVRSVSYFHNSNTSAIGFLKELVLSVQIDSTTHLSTTAFNGYIEIPFIQRKIQIKQHQPFTIVDNSVEGALKAETSFGVVTISLTSQVDTMANAQMKYSIEIPELQKVHPPLEGAVHLLGQFDFIYKDGDTFEFDSSLQCKRCQLGSGNSVVLEFETSLKNKIVHSKLRTHINDFTLMGTYYGILTIPQTVELNASGQVPTQLLSKFGLSTVKGDSNTTARCQLGFKGYSCSLSLGIEHFEYQNITSKTVALSVLGTALTSIKKLNGSLMVTDLKMNDVLVESASSKLMFHSKTNTITLLYSLNVQGHTHNDSVDIHLTSPIGPQVESFLKHIEQTLILKEAEQIKVTD